MISNLLTLTRQLVVLDTETTGLDVQTCRVVEIGFQVYYPDTTLCPTCNGGRKLDDPPCPSCDGAGRHYVKEWRTLINPLVPISKRVSDIHGITDAMVQGCQKCFYALAVHGQGEGEPHEFKPWPTFKQLAPSLAKGFTDCDFAGQNVRFDLRILDNEFKRSGVLWTYAGARIVDSRVLEQLAEPRSLSHPYKKYTGNDLEGAHSALTDVRATSTVIEGQLSRYEALPRDVAALHELQWPGWLTSDGSFRMIDGVPTCTFGKHNHKPMKDVPNDYYDYILKNDFPPDVKALARDAKMGRLP